MNISRRTIIWLGVVGAILLLGFIAFTTANGYKREAVGHETSLTSQYRDNQNELSSYISSFYEQVGIANLKSDKLDQILLDAVKGRYEGKTSAQPGQGQLFSAITEAYPDLSGLNIYDKIVDHIRGGREAYKNKQTKLLDMLRAYDNWRNSSLLRPVFLDWMGVPTDNLRAQVGKSVYTGAEAREKMYEIVLVKAANDAYDTGQMEPLTPPPGK